jgi:hypothetical protein
MSSHAVHEGETPRGGENLVPLPNHSRVGDWSREVSCLLCSRESFVYEWTSFSTYGRAVSYLSAVNRKDWLCAYRFGFQTHKAPFCLSCSVSA